MRSHKNINIEFMRVMAVLSVILIHTTMSHFHDPKLMTDNYLTWLVDQGYYAVTRFCVPIFFLISAYLTFNSISSGTVSKKIKKIGIPFVFWSLVYYVFWGGESVKEFTIKLFTSNTSFHLWFLPAFLGYVITLPFFASALKQEMLRKFRPAVIFLMAFSLLLPAVNYFLTSVVGGYGYLSGLNQFGMTFPTLLMYGIAFPYLYRKLSLFAGMAIYFSLIIINFTINVWVSHKLGTPNEQYYGFTTPLVFFSSFVLFNTIMNVKFDFLPDFATKLIVAVGDCSFGIYLCHFLVFVLGMRYGFIMEGRAILDPLVNTFIVFVISFIFIFFIRKIKLLRALV